MNSIRLAIIITLIGTTFVSAQTTRPFIPNTTQNQNSGARTFGGGINFSGVGGAIAGCADLSGKIQDGIGTLAKELGISKKKGGVTGLSVAVEAGSVKKQTEIANKKERCLDAAAYALAQNSLQQITNRTVNWVNTGFGGNPFYLRDTDSYLSSVANQEIRNFIGDMSGFSQGATGREVQNALIGIITGRQVPLLNTRRPSPAQQEYQSFMSDFRNGGWNSFFRSIDPGVNPIAQTLVQSQNLEKKITEKRTSIVQELMQNSGFLSWKKCVEYAKIKPNSSSITNDDALLDASINGENTDIPAIGQLQSNPDGSPACLRYETVTPGSVISAQLQAITNSPVRRLEQADELNEVLGSFFDQFVTKLFNQGLQSLSTGRQVTQNTSFGGPGSNVIIGTNGQVLVGTGGLLEFNQSQSGLINTDFNISNPRHLSAILKTQKDYLSQIQDSQASVQKIPLTLGKLDYCVPGPNPTWSSAVEASYPGFQGGILQANYNLKGIGFWQKWSGYDAVRGTPQEIAGTRIDVNNVWSYTTIDGKEATAGLISNLIGGSGVINFLTGGGTPTIDFSNVPPRLVEIVDSWYAGYRGDIENRYNLEKIQDAFVATKSSAVEQSFARTYVRDMYRRTEDLIGYSQASSALSGEYDDRIDETTVAIDRLETIRAKALAIVKTARARHIAEKKTQGITVNLTCLDQNYDVRDTRIVGKPRQENDATEEIATLEQKSAEFYANINP